MGRGMGEMIVCGSGLFSRNVDYKAGPYQSFPPPYPSHLGRADTTSSGERKSS